MKDYYFYITKTEGIVRVLKLGHRKRRMFCFKVLPDDWYIGKVFRVIGNARPFGKGQLRFCKKRL